MENSYLNTKWEVGTETYHRQYCEMDKSCSGQYPVMDFVVAMLNIHVALSEIISRQLSMYVCRIMSPGSTERQPTGYQI